MQTITTSAATAVVLFLSLWSSHVAFAARPAKGVEWVKPVTGIAETMFEISAEEAKNMTGTGVEGLEGYCSIRLLDRKPIAVRQYPRKLSADYDAKLAEICPAMIYYDSYRKRDMVTCCSPDILDELAIYLDTKVKIFDCPACVYNLWHTACRTLCEPDQARNMKINPVKEYPGVGNEVIEAKDGDGAFLVESWNQMMHACRDAKVKSTPITYQTAFCDALSLDCRDVEANTTRAITYLDVTVNTVFVAEPDDRVPLTRYDQTGVVADDFKSYRCGEAAPYPKDAKACTCDQCKLQDQREGCLRE